MCADNDDDCTNFEQHRQMMLDELDTERRGFLKSALVAGSGAAAAWAAGSTPVSAQAQGGGMARLVVLYKTPKDTAAFDRYYFETHVPIAKKIPGLRRYEVSRSPIATPAGPSGVHLIAILHFDDLPALQRGLASPDGKAAGDDLQNFATGGVDVLLFDVKEI
jgi:uncharacterized protein (TIGR02118 family)